MSVLVVDDDEQTRELLRSVFRSGGFEVETAADAAEASTALRRRGAFHLAFVDVNLPGKSGLVLLREIREQYPEILVAMVSGEASVESALEATRLGAVDYIAKPFVAREIAELANRLAASLRQRGTQAQPKAVPSDDIGILIVDDDPSIRIILGELFQDAGYRVDDAEAVFVAVQKLARGRFDIIFSDINMPGKTGIELLRDLRHANFDSQVVIMTADPTVETAVAATRLGAAEYLRKPFRSLDDVLTVAAKLAGRVRERRERAVVAVPPSGTIALVFTDVQESTRNWERRPDAMRSALELHNAVMRRTLATLGGYEVKTEGDSFMIAFPSAMAALQFCLAVQQALLEVAWPASLLEELGAEKRDGDGRLLWRGLRVRMGIHAGEPDCRLDPVTARMDYFGPVVNRASRIAEAAHGGQILVSERVWEEIESRAGELSAPVVVDHGLQRLKDLDTPERLRQILPAALGARRFPELRIAKLPVPQVESHASDDEIGEVWGQYRLSRKLSGGPLRECFLARTRAGAEGAESRIVLNRFRPELSANTAFVEAFLKDAQVAARLQHPNVVRILDLGQIGGSYYIASEYVSGWDLDTVLEACRALGIAVPLAFACRIACDVCVALGAMHSKSGIVHRSLSPSSVTLSIEGTVKLSDFAVGRAAEQLPDLGPAMPRYLPDYRAPEQIRHEPVIDGRADLFSAGAILWECLTGEHPLRPHGADLAAWSPDKPLAPISSRRTDLPSTLDAILECALQPKRELRYPTATAFQNDLEKLVSMAPSRRIFAEWIRHVFRRAVESGHAGLRARG